MASRGCPYHCRFCGSTKLRRTHSVEHVLHDVQTILKLGIRRLIFYDDLFCGTSKTEIGRIEALATGLLALEQVPSWSVELRADAIVAIGEHRLAFLRQAGMDTVNIGIERGSNVALLQDQKSLSIETVQQAVSILRKTGDITINGSFLLGGPEETPASLRDTVDFACSLALDFASFYPLEIHPGTPLYKQASQEGIIRPGLSDYLSMTSYPVYATQRCSLSDIMFAKACGYRQFYFRKHQLDIILKKHAEDNQRVLEMYRYWTDYVPDLKVPSSWAELISLCP